MRREERKLIRGIYDYLIIAIGMVISSLGWVAFLLPNKITIGGLPGVSSIVYWGMGIPVQYTYLAINVLLLAAALKVLGFKFCIKTIYAVVFFTVFTTFWQRIVGDTIMFHDQPFLACVVGGLLLGIGTGFSLLRNGSTGGSDVIASIVHKYHDVSLGHIILVCDLCVITSSYLVLNSWEKVIYGYIVLFVMSYTIDHVINGFRRSVQFFVISEKYLEIGRLINDEAARGCTVIDAHGFYSGKKMGMLFVIAKAERKPQYFQHY